jgi:hypothetical protein
MALSKSVVSEKNLHAPSMHPYPRRTHRIVGISKRAIRVDPALYL